MPFAEVEIIQPAPSATGAGVRISMRGKLRKTTVSLKSDVVDALGWSDGDAVKMLVGSGEDLGTLQFKKAEPATKGTATLKRQEAPRKGGTPFFTLALGFVAFTPKGAKSMTSEACEHDVLGGDTLEVELPASWRLAVPEVRTGPGAGTGTTVALNGKKAIIEGARAAVPSKVESMALRR
ncbi:hypothetical protein ATO13_22056 [Stappia sp. 22II-S9-Z10]|nr:hypothetical protein ATO13_22056 [Stappia sp. 22II-S9-Z10]